MPILSNSKIAPLGASEDIAVVAVTDAANAQIEESASPLKPNVVTDWMSSKVDNLDVWCFRARPRMSPSCTHNIDEALTNSCVVR